MDDDRLRAILRDLEEWEGSVPHLYCDSLGNVTIGIGYLVPHVQAAMCLPLRNVGWNRSATPDEKAADFHRVRLQGGGKLAAAYKAVPPMPTLRLQPEAVVELGVKKLRDVFLPGLAKLCPGFESYPQQAQSALVDMAWNMGLGKLGEFRHLLAACADGRWDIAARECSVKTSRYSRNAWRARQFAEAAGV